MSANSKISSAPDLNTPFRGKKILWVSSYHRGYEANDDTERGIVSGLHHTGVILHSIFMDTKRNDSFEFGEHAAQNVLAEIDEFEPDVIIASDDNAQRYLVEPYLKNSSIPVVFCGVNWNAAKYGYPAANVTGMVEVDFTREMFQLMRQYAKGDRIGYLSGDVEAERSLVAIYNEKFFHDTMKSYLVNSMAEFKEAFLRAQQENDMLYFFNYTGIKDWDPVEAELFISRHVRKPLGSHNGFMSQFVIFVVAKSFEEMGKYAAETALRILSGTSAEKIAVTENKQAELVVNLRMAKAASLVLPVSLLKTATVIGRMEAYLDNAPEFFQAGKYSGNKVLWVDSYNKGYKWSDGIERGLRNIFYETGVEFDVVRMDAMEHEDEVYKRKAALKAMEKIAAFKPDVIVASDDDAQEFLVVPYLKGKKIPVIFCGVNRTLGQYGYPAPNIAGMLEVLPVMDLQRYLRQYARGERVGLLAGDVPMLRELGQHYSEQFYGGKLNCYYVKNMKEFKQQFLAAQEEVDMLIFINYVGIEDWNGDEAVSFIEQNNTILTGTYLTYMEPYTIFSVGNLAEEQGYFAAKAALKVLDGVDPADIPVATNHLSRLVINIDQANAANLVLPYRLLRSAKIVNRRDANLVQ